MRQAKPSNILLLTISLAWPNCAAPLHAQSTDEAVEAALVAVHPHDRVVQPVDDSQSVSLDGNTLPQALTAYETGRLDGERRLERMLLTLKPDPAQQSALDELTAAQQDPASPLYRQWLTPEIYAEHFGASTGDIEQVQNWLERFGLQIDEVAASHRALFFSGTVAQVEAAFQTTMRSYRISGENHIANASDPLIPAALAPVVGGVVSLHDFFSAPQHNAIRVSPEYTSASAHFLSPDDFATIYDVSSLYRQAVDGTGRRSGS